MTIAMGAFVQVTLLFMEWIHGMAQIVLSEFDGKITRVVHVCDSTEDKRFIVYYMQYLAFQGVYKLISNGVRGKYK